MPKEEKNTTEHDHGDRTDLAHADTNASFPQRDDIANLSEDHRQYLFRKHGTLDLHPVPSMSDADPYNWPRWKKNTNLLLVAFHALIATFTPATIVPAFGDIAEDLNVTIQKASYLTALQIAILGCGPLLWRPLSSRYGRRPMFIASLVGSFCFNIGSAKAQSYDALAACSAFTTFFICPAGAIGSAVVVETFFKNERAKCMGIWTLMFTLGVPTAPLIFGFVAYRVGYRWIYWILAMINAFQLILYIFLGPETRFNRHNTTPQTQLSTFKESYFRFRRIDRTPLTILEFISPLRLVKYPCVLIPAVAYAMTYLCASTIIIIELPALFKAKFGFNPEQLGLQYIGIIIGSLIGEQLGGRLSDYWMKRARSKSANNTVLPEHRLWLAYPGYLFCMAGTVIFFVRTEQAPQGQWNVTPIVGAGVASVGKQMLTTVLITYAVDCYHEEAASIGVFVTFVRQMWNFIGPFWFPQMFRAVGLIGSAGVAVGLMVASAFLPTVVLQCVKGRWRFAMRGGD
ncbi:unnamed protein product [Periconia digitata]|uniref:Major facilitator superfamily (MFS) profile domain-containing protein n=1 Tax=Periconia digitata TaxID=1303443 RepID=A0A9W4XKB3_9PLEO|nr:unnamed protein product [Periconia digitata]